MKNPRTLTEKRILAAFREREAIWKAQREMVTLEEPIQRGWKRHFVLAEAAKSRPDRVALETILKEINEVRYHWRASFRDGKSRRERTRRGHRFHEHEQQLRGIFLEDWPAPKWPEAWRGYFRLVRTIAASGAVSVRYRFIRDDLFRLKTERHFITELPLLDPALEEREAEINAWLDCGDRRHTGERLRHGSAHGGWNHRDGRRRVRARLEQRRIRAAYAGDWEADARTFPPGKRLVVGFLVRSRKPLALARFLRSYLRRECRTTPDLRPPSAAGTEARSGAHWQRRGGPSWSTCDHTGFRLHVPRHTDQSEEIEGRREGAGCRHSASLLPGVEALPRGRR